MDFEAATDCPYCQVALLTAGTDESDWVRCSNCGRKFSRAIGATVVRTSRLAIASLVVGLGSLFCGFLSGIPAVLLGLLALRRIHRSESRLRGRPLAICGIVSGGLLGLGCGAFVGLTAWIASEVHTTKDANEIVAMAADLGSFDLPPEVKPIEGDQLPLGIKLIHYADLARRDKAGVLITTVYYPNWMGFDRQRAAAQVVYYSSSLRGVEIDEEEEFTLLIDGENVVVTRQVRRGKGPQRFRAYVAVLEANQGWTLNIISVEDTPAEDDNGSPPNGQKVTWTDEQVRAVLESHRRVPE